MKVAVIGTGAMGSVYAGLLAAAGNEVWAVDVWPAHIEAIREKGLRVEGASGDRVVRLSATTEPSEVGPCDLIIIATKARHVEAAAESAKRLLGNDSTVLPMQNGLGSYEKVVRILGPERVAIGIAGGFGATIQSPGHVYHNGWELVRLGEMAGPVTPRIERIAELWRGAGFTVKAYDDIHRMVWEKLICNVCYSATCTVTERTIGEVLGDDNCWRVASGCAVEAYNVARAKGIAVAIDDPVAFVRAFGEKLPNARPSMLTDHMEGRASEIDVINGAIPREGDSVGVAAPYNEVMTALVKAKEARLGLK